MILRLKVFISVLLVVSACNPSPPPSQSTELPIQPTVGLTQSPTMTLEPAIPTPSPTPPTIQPDLTHQPLYWFGPLPPLPVVTGRLFTGSDDFMQLFKEGAPWPQTAENIQVFKLYGEWVFNHQGDDTLKTVVADLNRRGLAIAVETGPLDPDGCGDGIEGFATVEASLRMARAIQSAGGTLHLIALDEPYYFGHFYDGPNACHWSAEKIAVEVDEFIREVREIFPDVIIGDTEPLAGFAGSQEYNDWLDTFYEVNGYHLAFLHMDIDWSRPTWAEEVKAIQTHGKTIGVPVGIIYNGNAADKTDEDFLSASGERVKKLELVTGVLPDHVVFQSWSDKPDRVLPETEPFTYTGFIQTYFTDKSQLGYRREGKGANVALGKTVQVSSQTGDLSGSLAVDGDFGTLWNSGGGPTQWIEIDLGEAFELSEIRLTVSQYPAGKTVHQIKGKGPLPGDKYILLQTLDGNTQDGDELLIQLEDSLAEIRYVRVETTESPSWVAWREIEVISR